MLPFQIKRTQYSTHLTFHAPTLISINANNPSHQQSQSLLWIWRHFKESPTHLISLQAQDVLLKFVQPLFVLFLREVTLFFFLLSHATINLFYSETLPQTLRPLISLLIFVPLPFPFYLTTSISLFQNLNLSLPSAHVSNQSFPFPLPS